MALTLRSPTLRQPAAIVTAAVGVEAAFSAATPDRPGIYRLIGRLAPPALPSSAHLLALLTGLALIVLAPKMWRGMRAAVSLAIGALLVLALLNILKGLDWDEALLNVLLVGVLLIGRDAFPLGSRRRPQLVALCLAVGAWALTYSVLLFGPLVSDRGHTLRDALHNSLGRTHLSPDWVTLVEALLACAVTMSILAFRSLLRPVAGPEGHSENDYRAARDLIEREGRDSLAPFILRADKSFHFDRSGVLAYRLIGETAVVSGDPVAAPGCAAAVLESFRSVARERGWHVVLWGASDFHLASYRGLGMRSICVGEEAFVDPQRFTLDGRHVRKLRQSVNRLQRRGWQVMVRPAREIDDDLLLEIDRLERRWQAHVGRVRGFAMTMGSRGGPDRPGDLYAAARSPEGELRAVMRFVSYRGGLSLDAMHRLDRTPNGLNEALISQALCFARQRGIREVSLNYAGLGHLVRGAATHRGLAGVSRRVLLSTLGRHFQMGRLVRFDEKFDPQWRGRFLVHDSCVGLPRAATRVLQAEGYLPEVSSLRIPLRWQPARTALPGSPHTDAAR